MRALAIITAVAGAALVHASADLTTSKTCAPQGLGPQSVWYPRPIEEVTETFSARAPAPTSSGGDSEPSFTVSELYTMTQAFWDSFIFPADASQAATLESPLLAEDIRGRVDVTRTFTGRRLNTEYLYGLWANRASSAHMSLLGFPIAYTMTHFVGLGNVVSCSITATFNISWLPEGAQLWPVVVDNWMAFNKDKQLTQYDTTFRWFDYFVASVLQAAAPVLHTTTADATTAALQGILAKGVCDTYTQYCAANASNAQYASLEACVDFLTSSIRFGQPYELGMNTLLCRMVHEAMVPSDPDVHCPHIGPSGGGQCVDDYTYESKVDEVYFGEMFMESEAVPAQSNRGAARTSLEERRANLVRKSLS